MANFGSEPSNHLPAGQGSSLPGGADALGALATPSKKWAPTQPLVLGLVFVVSASALYGMRMIGIKHAIAFDGAKQFEFDPQEDAAFQQHFDNVMSELSSVNNPLDIALVDFGRSPFALPGLEDVLTKQPILPGNLGPTPEQLRAAEAARLREKIAAAAANIHVQSVMAGRVPLARIDDEVVRVGDMIDDTFKVVSIEGRSVTIEAGEQRFMLTMMNPGDEQNSPKKKPKRK